MIKIVAKSIVKNGMKENFKQVARELITETWKEKGCISFNIYEDMNNENNIIFIEDWKDENSIELHHESDHVKRILPELVKLREGIPKIDLYKLIK